MIYSFDNMVLFPWFLVCQDPRELIIRMVVWTLTASSLFFYSLELVKYNLIEDQCSLFDFQVLAISLFFSDFHSVGGARKALLASDFDLASSLQSWRSLRCILF